MASIRRGMWSDGVSRPGVPETEEVAGCGSFQGGRKKNKKYSWAIKSKMSMVRLPGALPRYRVSLFWDALRTPRAKMDMGGASSGQ